MVRGLALSTACFATLGLAAPTSAQQAYEFEDLVYLSCAEAWEEAEQSVDNAVAMIKVLAEFSLDKRQLEVPENEPNLADQFGELVKAYCTAEPDDLLYNAVDRSIRRLL